MQPPHGAAGSPLSPSDAFDVPVLVRRSSPLTPGRRPTPVQLDNAHAAWPLSGGIPSAGIYRVMTTWRDVIDAALTVGRDPTGWLTAVPKLAWSELLARRAPLLAYLGRRATVGTKSGYLIEPNVVYRDGTEQTAQAALGYRIGMTMAEWACRGLMRLGPTTHAEAVRPAGAGPAWTVAQGLPDLVGLHTYWPTTWLVEAKGGRKLKRPALVKGAAQLTRPRLMEAPHMRGLCGTSLEPCLFVTIDAERVAIPAVQEPETPAGLAGDELLALARSRLLVYLSLEALPRSELSIVPVG